MNKLEKTMVGMLLDLKRQFHVTGVKAEFEAEGTRMEEAMRLKEVSMAAGLGLNIKVGGCEALKDMFDAGSLGAERIIAPMVETPYALKKFLSAARLVLGSSGDRDAELLINVETITTIQNFDAILNLPEIGQLDGVVIGRVDLTGSMGLTREDINCSSVLDLAIQVAQKAKNKGLDIVVGGGVSVHSIPFFRAFPAGALDRFETRKIIFSCPAALQNSEEGFLRANEFELAWLKNKKEYYGAIFREDDARIAMLEERYRKGIEAYRMKQALTT